MIVLSKVTGASTISGLKIQNYPVHCFSISNCDSVIFKGITLDNTAGNAANSASGGKPAAHNTDGFDIGTSTNIALTSSRVLNQDDCVAITSGDSVTVSNMHCDGGHGLSIGSVGGKSNNNVTNIVFQDSVVLNSQNGARIKTNSGTTGLVSGITYKNIAVSAISDYGIDIQQDYLNGGPTGTPTNGVIIKGVMMQNITGTATSKAQDYYILCGSGSCSGFIFNDISITGGKSSSCNFQPSGNFKC
jgi:polygalacturonase